MSERPDPTFKEKMAIPEGVGEDHMDVSFSEETQAGGYVDIKSKGPGKPIHIRGNEKPQTLSQIVKANFARSELSDVYTKEPVIHADQEDGYRRQPEMFLDKSTGHGVSLENGIHDNAQPADDNEPEQTVRKDQSELWYKVKEEYEQKITFPDAGFTCQAQVVSLGSNARQTQQHSIDSPGKMKYRLHQARAKKKIGSKKNNCQGKDGIGLPLVARKQPYPKWVKIPMSAIFGGQSCVDIDGRKHLLEIKLVSVEEVPNELPDFTTQEDGKRPGVDPVVTGDIHAEGSIDRPPDDSYHQGKGKGPSSAVLLQTEAGPSWNSPYTVDSSSHMPGNAEISRGIVSAPNNYGNRGDQPLDLTVVQPLDLSKKGNPSHEAWEEKKPFLGKCSEVSSLTSMDISVDPNTRDYRSRCPSSLSVDDRDSVIDEEPLDHRLASQCSSEPCSSCDGAGNLPSFSRLTLDSSRNLPASATIQSGIQDSSVKQEVNATVRGQQSIGNLPTSNQITLQKILELVNQVQQTRFTHIQQNMPRFAASADQQQQPQQQVLQTQQAVSQIDDTVTEQEIPAPAMPNFQSLELTDNNGGILEKESERIKSRLNAKLQLKK